MMIVTQNIHKLITFFILIFLASYRAYADNGPSLTLPNKEKISLRLAITPEEQTKGLSGLKSSQFKDNEGMLFINSSESERRFWMPDTYFNLDIIFLDRNFKITGIETNVPAHPGLKQPPDIYKTQTYKAQYILELKSNSNRAGILKIGDHLNIVGLNLFRK